MPTPVATPPPPPSPTPTPTPVAVTPEPTPDFTPEGTLQAGTCTFLLEVADTGEERARGLMNRPSLPPDRGMLFVWEEESVRGFWMLNTLIPLDIAYLAADGTVLEIVHGVPHSPEVLRPAQPYRHTLEVNAGWFERQGFGIGDVVSIPEGMEAEE